jgi:hypothetical protein
MGNKDDFKNKKARKAKNNRVKAKKTLFFDSNDEMVFSDEISESDLPKRSAKKHGLTRMDSHTQNMRHAYKADIKLSKMTSAKGVQKTHQDLLDNSFDTKKNPEEVQQKHYQKVVIKTGEYERRDQRERMSTSKRDQLQNFIDNV